VLGHTVGVREHCGCRGTLWVLGNTLGMGLWVEGTQTEENIYGLAILFLVTLCLFINDRTLEATIAYAI
jgi:hypothetical protein